MKLADTLRGLLRRWYIVFPGLLLAVAIAIGGWFVVRPDYERTATELLLPGAQSIPVGANPYIFLGGLSQAADVLVRAAGADSVVDKATAAYPGVKVEITRDGSTPGPIVLIKVTAPSDASAAAVLTALTESTALVLNDLQESEQIPADNRITVRPVTVDETSTLQQRNRIIVSAGAGIAVAAGALLLAGFVDGLIIQRRRRGKPGSADDSNDTLAAADAPEEIDPDDAQSDEPQSDEPLSTERVDADSDALQDLLGPTESAKVEETDSTESNAHAYLTDVEESDDDASNPPTAEVMIVRTGGRTRSKTPRRSE